MIDHASTRQEGYAAHRAYSHGSPTARRRFAGKPRDDLAECPVCAIERTNALRGGRSIAAVARANVYSERTVGVSAVLDPDHDDLPSVLTNAIEHAIAASPGRPDSGEVSAQRFADATRFPHEGRREDVETAVATARASALSGPDARGGSGRARTHRLDSPAKAPDRVDTAYDVVRAYAASASRMSLKASGSLRRRASPRAARDRRG